MDYIERSKGMQWWLMSTLTLHSKVRHGAIIHQLTVVIGLPRS